MNEIYDEYEFDNRLNNLAWTVSGDYKENIDVLEKKPYPKKLSLYFALVAGARRKYVDYNIVKKYIFSRVKKGYNKEAILSLIEIVLNKII